MLLLFLIIILISIYVYNYNANNTDTKPMIDKFDSILRKIQHEAAFKDYKHIAPIAKAATDTDFGDLILDAVELFDYTNGFTDDTHNIEKFNTTSNSESESESEDIILLPKTQTPKNIFSYWEKKDTDKIYSHITLCFKTMKKYYRNYNFVILNEHTIKDYLPDLRTDLQDLLIAQKVDYYRIALLYRYGGVWIDADTIALRPIDELFEKLDNGYDFVGFGCTGKTCFNGYPKPSNGVMGSRKHGALMECCLHKLNDTLNTNNKKHNYFDLGKKIIWKCLDELFKSKYSYYHFPSEYDGSRDHEGYWIHTPDHFSKSHTQLLDENKAMFIFLANYEITNDTSNKWILSLSEDDLLNGPWFISSLYRKALS